MSRISTQYFKNVLPVNMANDAYLFLKENIEWEQGIYSKTKKKYSRKAYHHNPESGSLVDDYIQDLIVATMNKIGELTDENMFAYYGVYLNYYEDGNDFCPNHSHKSTIQLVLSLGATRTLTVGKKDYEMNSGDAIIFGSSIHGIPEEPEIEEGRISIAIFLVKKKE